ncbi:hypothetical protein BgiBS90_008606 [Biomphalaria glabrata]|nr:hypothetical protein BgiBS90_008606 [Biomphalaria glabrata]
MESRLSQLDLNNLESSFHQNLLSTFTDLTENLQQLISDVETDARTTDDNQDIKYGIWELVESFKHGMKGIEKFIDALNNESALLDREIEAIEVKRQEYLTERDVLIEKGHELNCRIGYNALERKLDESFSSIEKYANEASAKCFRDEAEETLKQTHNLIRIANMRACQLDRDTFKEMEKITTLFENFERDREYYVKELDLFSDMKRNKISLCLSEPCSHEVREKGENILDYLNLSQKQRHMEAQVIKNTLRMYSFNASLNFDREDNLKMMEELTNLQSRANKLTGAATILPRSAKAKMDVTIEEDPNREDEGQAGGEKEEDNEGRGKGLHRCPRKINLATEPITEPTMVVQLEALLKWEDSAVTPSTSCDIDLADVVEESFTETQSLTVASNSLTMTEGKLAFSLCGDAEAAHIRPSRLNVTDEDGCLVKTDPKPIISSTHSFLSHLESSTGLPGSDQQMMGLVRKKHNSRPVGSLTNVLDSEKVILGCRDNDSPPRDTRSQSSEHSRPTFSGNRSREHVSNSGCTGD